MRHKVKLSPEGQLICPVCDNALDEMINITYSNDPDDWSTNPIHVDACSEVAVTTTDLDIMYYNRNPLGVGQECAIWCTCSVCHGERWIHPYKVVINAYNGKIMFEFEDYSEVR